MNINVIVGVLAGSKVSWWSSLSAHKWIESSDDLCSIQSIHRAGFPTWGSTFLSRIHSWSGDFIVPCINSRPTDAWGSKAAQERNRADKRSSLGLLHFFCICYNATDAPCRKVPVLSRLTKGHSPRSFAAFQHAVWQIFFFLMISFHPRCTRWSSPL